VTLCPIVPCCLGPPCQTLGPDTALWLYNRVVSCRADRHDSPSCPCRPVASRGVEKLATTYLKKKTSATAIV
jgi:hypothetical protein